MASYRPKSLNELNKAYDKSIASQNVIKDTASAIDLSAFDNTVAVKAQTEEFFKQESISSAPAGTDLSAEISDFIKNFGKPASPDDEVPQPRRTPVKPRPAQPKAVKPVAVTPVAAEKIEEAPTAAINEPDISEKTELVITPERSELFDEYMRVMSDEEDDDIEFETGRKHRKKRGKKSAEPIYEDDSFTADLSKNESVSEVKVEPETEQYEEKPDSIVEESSDADNTVEPDTDSFDYEAQTEETDSDYYDSQEEEPSQKESKKGGFLKVALLMFLLITLISALAVTAFQAVLKVDSGLPLNDRYYFYTVSKTDTIVGINEGDLLMAETERVSNGDVFAFYKTADKSFDFAVKTFTEGSDITTGDNSDGPVRLRNTDIFGKVTRIYPSVGKIASFIKDNFILVISFHVVIAAIALILFVFAGKSKKNKDDADNFSFDENEDEEETLEEHFSLKSRK